MIKQHLNIDGSEYVFKIYEKWPSFHDAEIISLNLDRAKSEGSYGPTVIVEIHYFEITNEVVNNHYKTVKHNIIKLSFYDVVEFELDHGFGQQNPLSGITIIDIRRDQLENIHYKVSFDAHMNCDLRFKCSTIKVLSIEEGMPDGSVYA